jgi:hypothetical protein
LPGAIADFDKAIDLNPRYAKAYGGRGVTRLLQGKDAEAEKDFKTCAELDARLRKTLEPLIEAAKAKRGRAPGVKLER